MLSCAPAIDMAAIVRDTSVNPTTPKTAPPELIMAFVLRAGFVLPGLLLGVLARAWLHRLRGIRLSMVRIIIAVHGVDR